MPGNGFRQAVTCNGYHSVCCNGSVFCNRNIGGTGTHIHQCNVKHTEFFGNSHLNGGNRLQCQINCRQACQLYCLIQAVHNVLGQESHNHIRADVSGFVLFRI